MAEHGLTAQQLESIRAVLAPFSAVIDRVALFGSRATGQARANSDVDLVLYGALDEAIVDRIWTLFDASNLALTVDLNAYDLISYPPLREHIDRVGQTLFTKTELLRG
jgi:predicted nucleotidyltransferase